jgi:hypothetical protein
VSHKTTSLQKLFFSDIVAIVIQCFCIKIWKEKTKGKVTVTGDDRIDISEFIVLDEF